MGSNLDVVRDKSREVQERFNDSISDGRSRVETARRQMDQLLSLPEDVDEEIREAASLAMESVKDDAHADIDAEVHSRVVEGAIDGGLLRQEASDQLGRDSQTVEGLRGAASVGDYGAIQINQAVSATEANMADYRGIIEQVDASIRKAYSEVDLLQKQIDAL